MKKQTFDNNEHDERERMREREREKMRERERETETDRQTDRRYPALPGYPVIRKRQTAIGEFTLFGTHPHVVD